MAVIKYIYNFFCRPFTENLSFLFLLTFLVSSADVVGYICYGRLIFAGILGVHGYIMCYFITLVICILPNKISKILKKVFVFLGYINLCVDITVQSSCKTNFTTDMVAIIYGTNIGESKEFIQSYVSWKLGVYIIAALVAIFLFKNIAHNIDRLGTMFIIKNSLLLLTISGTLYLLIEDTSHWGGIFINKIATFLKYETPPNLNEYLTKPDVIVTKETPDNIICIIGESFSKFHSSIYGYERNTNPKLSKMVVDSMLFVYTDVESPATTTIKSFMSIFSTFSPQIDNGIKWYENTTLQEVMSLAGYRTVWLSNQSPAGLVDNVISEYAELCDTTIFVGDKFKGNSKVDFDEEVLVTLKSMNNENIEKSFIVIHLMGSHPNFKERYPNDFTVWKSEDYLNLPRNQRELTSYYDNSILYNDTVVSSIIEYYENTESIVYYFSDHGMDIFYSSDEYCGHARANDEISINMSLKIPYVVYLSEQFQRKFIEESTIIKNSKDEFFSTDFFMENMLKLFGIEYITSRSEK